MSAFTAETLKLLALILLALIISLAAVSIVGVAYASGMPLLPLPA
jgi:hypothetical protein